MNHIIEKLSKIFPDFPIPEKANQIPGDGSDRRFFRLWRSGDSFILIVHPPTTETVKRENKAFSVFGRHLRNLGIPVPEIIAEDHSEGCFLVQDVGNMHVQDFQKKQTERARKILYRRILRLLVNFHTRAYEAFDASSCLDGYSYDPCFVLEKELEYFRRSFLNDFLSLNIKWDHLSEDFFYLAEKAGASSCDRVIHRDFQSRNLMVHRGKLYMLDFQGMRYGPPEYDVASLYLDPYVSAEKSERISWVTFYASLNPAFSPERFDAVKLCRNLQILAAFAFLTKRKGKIKFATYIPRAWKALRCNAFLKNCPKLKRLRDVLEAASPHLQKVMDSIAITCYRRKVQGNRPSKNIIRRFV